MPDHANKTIIGRITHIFAHRFVIKTPSGEFLADLTPKGVDKIALHLNDEVTLVGEMKRSELKVRRLTRGTTTIEIAPKHKKDDDDHPYADPSMVLASTRAAGYQVVGALRRKPKHFEVLGQRKGAFHELHIALDGHIRKSRPIARDDPKWSVELSGEARD
jgi:hypothetical protein